MSLTLIEFYDKSPLANVASILALRPKKVIFLGKNIRQMRRNTKHYQSWLAAKDIETLIECHSISLNSLLNMQKEINCLIEENPNCVFDITGGNELALVALGSLTPFLKEKNIAIHRVNLHNQRTMALFPSKIPFEVIEPKLTIAESVSLYGGRVIFDNERSGATHLWDWSDSFCHDVNLLWQLVRRNCVDWNSQITQLGSVINPNSTYVSGTISETLSLWYTDLFYEMQVNGLIHDLFIGSNQFSFKTKDTQISRALGKAGTVLELKTCLLVRELQGLEAPHFNDILTGVYIDWDGKIKHEKNNVRDTENEIDVMCVRGLRPLFISCKNGSIDEVELYKLQTVSKRFGGEYGRAALIASYIDRNISRVEYLRQRAADMGITLIEDVDLLDDHELSRKLKALLS